MLETQLLPRKDVYTAPYRKLVLTKSLSGLSVGPGYLRAYFIDHLKTSDASDDVKSSVIVEFRK